MDFIGDIYGGKLWTDFLNVLFNFILKTVSKKRTRSMLFSSQIELEIHRTKG